MQGIDPATASELSLSVRRALNEPLLRVRPLVLESGRRFWLKRIETLPFRLRLTKGNPARAFAAERQGLHALDDLGMPVPQIALEGPDYFVLPDVGVTLMHLVADPATDEAQKLSAFASAGAALGGLHRAGLVHGRPAVRDICWDGETARFIDLERFSPKRRSRFWQALDVLLLAHSAYTQWPADSRWLDAAIEGYAKSAPADARDGIARAARRLAPLGMLARGLKKIGVSSRELRALLLVLERFDR